MSKRRCSASASSAGTSCCGGAIAACRETSIIVLAIARRLSAPISFQVSNTCAVDSGNEAS